MRKTDLIKDYKAELREIEIQEQFAKQTLGSITRRKWTIKAALEKLGSPVQPPKGKKGLSTSQKMGLLAGLTK